MKKITRRNFLKITTASTALATLALAGCGDTASSTQTSTSTGGETSQETGSGEAVEINVMLWDRGQEFQSGMDMVNNNATKFVQEAVLAEKNVKINFIAVNRSSTDDLLNTMMAGGTAPDMVMTYSRDMFVDYAVKGGLADLTAAYEAHGANIEANIPYDTVTSVGVVDGMQYAILNSRDEQKARHTGKIRKDWLDALGLPIPTTTQELEDALYAFKEQDPGNVGAENVIPWVMAGKEGTEKQFQTFVTSFINGVYEGENLWTYQENNAVFHPEAKAGFDKLNQYYNDGIINNEFAVDTTEDAMKAAIANGYAGFLIGDDNGPTNELRTTYENVPEAQWVLVNCFTGSGTEYQGNTSNPIHGMYNFVPKASEEKVEAVMKYMDWLAVPENSLKLRYGLDYTLDEFGAAVSVFPSNDDKIAAGWPITPADITTVKGPNPWSQDQNALIQLAATQWTHIPPTMDPVEYATMAYESLQKDLHIYPIIPQFLEAETTLGKPVQDLLVQSGFRIISAPRADFEATYQAEADAINQAGLTEIVAEKLAYYTENV